MPQNPLDFLELLIESPGDLIFFLLVFALSQASLFLAFSLRSRCEDEQAAHRYVLTTIALVGIWLSLMAVASFSQLSSFEAAMLMPPLERLGMSLSLVFITWAFLSAENAQQGTRATLWLGAAIVLILLLFLYTASDWYDNYETGTMFNAGELAPPWSLLPLAVGVLGFIAVAFNFNRIFDAPLKSLFFLLIVLGNGWDSWQFANSELTGSYLGSARWAYLAALALVPVVMQRLAVATMDNRLVKSEASISQLRLENESLVARQRDIAAAESDEPSGPMRPDESIASQENRQLATILGMMVDQREASGTPEQILAIALELLDAEVALLLRMEDEAYASVIASYANANSQNWDGMSISLAELPTIVAAAQRQAQRSLAVEIPAQEVAALFQALRIDLTGTAYIQPISPADELPAILLVARLYRQGKLSSDQLALFGAIGQVADYCLAASDIIDDQARQEQVQPVDGDKTAELREQLKRLSADHESLLNLREQMRRDYQELLQRFEARDKDNRSLQERIGELQRQLEIGGARRSDLERNITELSSERDNLLRIRDQLTARLADSLPVSAEVSGETALRTRLQELQDTVATLNDQREQLTLELSDAKTALAAANLAQGDRAESREAVTAVHRLVELEQTLELVREMGAPVAAISECADILLQESIGILGAAQLEVVQRVSANLGRLTTVLESLMQFSHEQNDEQVLQYAETDIVDLLDETITILAPDIRAKQLALELSVDDKLPKIMVDADCIKQILRHLLRNACAVSSRGAPIIVTAAVLPSRSAAGEEPVEAVRISVEDKGGGISAKELPRVFARKYLREYPKIDGLSDTGVGLTVARAYARAHAGDLSIASKAGEGSVFHLDLPTRPLPPVGN